jgi:hypothetical protein
LSDKETLQRNEHLIISYILDNQNNKIRLNALIDFDVIEISFVNKEFARCHSLPLYKLKESQDLEIIDNRFSQAEKITHVIKIKLIINKHIEKLFMFVIKLEHYLLVLDKL